MLAAQSLDVYHYVKYCEKVWCVLALPQKVAAETVLVKDLSCKVAAQKKLHDCYKQVAPPRVCHVKGCTVAAKVVQWP